jgi:hypothetical protein
LEGRAEDFVPVDDSLDGVLKHVATQVAFDEDGPERAVVMPLPLLLRPKASLLGGKHKAFGSFALHHCLLDGN